MCADIPQGAPQDAAASPEQIIQHVRAAKAMKAVLEARERLIAFTKITMPDPTADEPDASLYEEARHHLALADVVERAERGEIPRLIVTLPPRHGKSELISRRLLAWAIGRDPTKQIIFSTYNDEFAKDFGRDVREIMRQEVYQKVFPRATLRKGGAAADRLDLSAGGKLIFVGRGGALTGRGGHLLVLDDPFKDASEANSAATRQAAWDWFTRVFYTRRMHQSSVIIVMTRWHEDDIVGRLTDPTNPHFNEDEARNWKIVNLPAFAEEQDPLGRAPGEPLWPERYGKDFLEAQKRLDARAFSALYQQRPSPEDGDYFKREYIKLYRPDDRPTKDQLRIFAVSDHAVATKQHNDRTCMIVFGVDENRVIWVLDVFWRRVGPKEAVEAVVTLIKKWKPLIWWAEKGHISRSLGPFLRVRMQQEHAYCRIDEVTPVADKVTRAGSIMGRFAHHAVRFPRGAPWVQDAIDELMKFPAARFDDFVDAMSLIGLGVERQIGPSGMQKPVDQAPPRGTFDWVKWQAKKDEQRRSLSMGGLGGF